LKTLDNYSKFKTRKITKHKGSSSSNQKTKTKKQKQKDPTMSKTVDEEIDLTDINRNNSKPTLISINKARREISRQLQPCVCADPHTHDHGHSYIVWSDSEWIKKRQVTEPIVPPTNPGAYRGTTYQLLEAHQAKQLAWKRYKLAQGATK
jgi:hypothetical protein